MFPALGFMMSKLQDAEEIEYEQDARRNTKKPKNEVTHNMNSSYHSHPTDEGPAGILGEPLGRPSCITMRKSIQELGDIPVAIFMGKDMLN